MNNLFNIILKLLFSLFGSKSKKPIQTPEYPTTKVPETVIDEPKIVEVEEVETEPVPVPKHEPRIRWILDNGHGILTKGKRSPEMESGGRFFEWEFNRDIVRRIVERCDEIGLSYHVLVPEVQVDNIVRERTKRANELVATMPQILVSVHSNAAPAPKDSWCAPSTKGIEVWYKYADDYSREVADIFQKHLLDRTGFKDRNTKSKNKKQFYILRNSNMPSILTENGFFNNKAECLELMKPEVRQQIAEAHVQAMLEVESLIPVLPA